MPDTGNQLKLSRKAHAAPRGALFFYRRFIVFNIVFLCSTNDSYIYQSAKAPDTYCMRDIFAHHYVSIGLNTEQYLTDYFSQPAEI